MARTAPALSLLNGAYPFSALHPGGAGDFSNFLSSLNIALRWPSPRASNSFWALFSKITLYGNRDQSPYFFAISSREAPAGLPRRRIAILKSLSSDESLLTNAPRLSAALVLGFLRRSRLGDFFCSISCILKSCTPCGAETILCESIIGLVETPERTDRPAGSSFHAPRNTISAARRYWFGHGRPV